MIPLVETSDANRLLQSTTTTSTATIKPLTIVNNCGQDISNFKAYYNVYRQDDDNSYQWRYQQFASSVAADESVIIPGVSSASNVHFYGIHTTYSADTGAWTSAAVAYSDTKSNLWSRVNFSNSAGVTQYPVYMESVDLDSWEVRLCTVTVPVTPAPPVPTKTLTARNNCGKDITHFMAFYNFARAGNTGGVEYETFGPVPVASGGSVGVPGVEAGSTFHYYGLKLTKDTYPSFVWLAEEVAVAPTTSNYWTNVTWNGEPKFAVYTQEVDSDWQLDMCPSIGQNSATTSATTTRPTTTTTTTQTTSAASTTTHTTSATTTRPTTTTTRTTSATTTRPTTTNTRTTAATSATTTTVPNDDDATLTIRNNCGTDITHFKAHYRLGGQASYGNYYGTVANVGLPKGATLKIYNVEKGLSKSAVHFYGVHAGYDYSAAVKPPYPLKITEVAKAPQKSNMWTHVNINGTHQFPFYMLSIGAGTTTIDLCT